MFKGRNMTDGIQHIQPLDNFLKALEEHIAEPTHKRLIQAYTKGDPSASMEQELACILREIMKK